MTSQVSRRAVVAGVCGTACVGALAACSGYGAGTSAPPPAPAPASGSAPGSSGGGAAGGIGSATEVPVGGGKIFAAQQVVVTQPTAGQFKAFSSTCTHQGCQVGEVAGGTINCPCHGSKFAIADGSVVDGPAQKPLPAKNVTVSGGSITLA